MSKNNFEAELHAFYRRAVDLHRRFSRVTDLSDVSPAAWALSVAKMELLGGQHDSLMQQLLAMENQLAEAAVAGGHGSIEALLRSSGKNGKC